MAWKVAACFVFLLGSALQGRSGEPRVEWEFQAGSNLYAPPVIADFHPSAGLEIVLSDSDLKRLRCIDSGGEEVWEYHGGWKKRLTSSAALSLTARSEGPTLIVGSPDGELHCLDARTGSRLWAERVGPIEWGSAIWADVDGDGRDEAIAGTKNDGVVCFRADGNRLWTNAGEKARQPFHIRCPVAAADIDGDRAAEVFFASKRGLVCLKGDGSLEWESYTGDDFISTVVVADANRDGAPELYAASLNENALWCFDARVGSVLWTRPLFEAPEVYSGSAIAVGDLDRDGREEVVLADGRGNVHCFSCDGALLWVFETSKKTHAGATLGDVDGDGEIEILVASGDRNLYCLNAAGELEWRWTAALRLISPPTLADIDLDGKTEIVFGASDGKLRVLTLDGRCDPALLPWPSSRHDPEQSGSSFGCREQSIQRTIQSEMSLFEFGGFEIGRLVNNPEDYPKGTDLRERIESQPQGWIALSSDRNRWRLDREKKRFGAAALKVVPGTCEFTFGTELLPLASYLESIRAKIHTTDPGARVSLVWLGRSGLLREDSLRAQLESSSPGPEGWRLFDSGPLVPPKGSLRVQLACTTPGEGTEKESWWDDAEIVGSFKEPPSLRAMVNQAGYDIGAPKRFTAQSNFIPEQARFEILNESGETVFQSALESRGRIRGSYGHDWGYNYWRGDFTEYNQPGRYRIRLLFDNESDLSWPFEIGEDLLWEMTSRPAYRFFYYQRCGAPVPGFHDACHLDDAVSEDGNKQFDLAGGWHDAGDYNKYHNAPYVLGLATAYGLQKEAFDLQDLDGNGLGDFFDEILWGGDFSRRMIAPDGSVRGALTSGYEFWGPPEYETDNMLGTGDERPIRGAESGGDSSTHTAAMAKIARYLRTDNALFVEAAERGLNWALQKGMQGPLQLGAALDLYVATRKEPYADLAKEIFAKVGVSDPEVVRSYDEVFGEDHSSEIKQMLMGQAEEALALADNPFGVYTHGPKENPNFFGRPQRGNEWYVGTSSFILEAANRVAMAYRYEPDPRYQEFVYDQFNWILGNNPYDISLMEGVGSSFPPTYHHRYTFAGVPRGAVPGSVVNGITLRAPGDDRPYLDMRGLDIPDFQSNEVWLPHNTNYLKALANLRAARKKKN